MRRYFFDWLFYVIMWVVVTMFFSFIFISLINAGIDFFNISAEVAKEPIYRYMISYKQYIEALIFGILFGTATFLINLAVDYTGIHRMSFGKTIIIKTILYFLAIAIVFILMAGIILTSGMSPVDANDYFKFYSSNPVPPSLYIAIIVFFIMSTMLINFIALVSKKFGSGQMLLIF